jgi:hypothetical protein
MRKHHCGLSIVVIFRGNPNICGIEPNVANKEAAMLTRQTQNGISATVSSRARQVGTGVMTAATIAAFSVTTVPATAHAGGVGPGAAIGLGVLGGVLAGAAIASTTPAYYGVPPAPIYDYQPQPYPGYYYAPAPAYYPAQRSYFYGWTPYR